MAILADSGIILTGASSGIGAALAKAFSAAGARVALFARREKRLAVVAGECSGETVIVPGDMTLATDREKLVETALDFFGRVDILVNNAGLGAYGSFLDSTEDDWRRLFELNLFSAVELTRAVLPGMIEQDRGLILNIASIGGLVAHADKVTPYVASKHALLGFSRGLAKDLVGTGIRVKVACPHLTDTEFFRTGPGAREMSAQADQYRSFMDTPEEVAQGVVDQLDQPELVIFPTDKPAKAYAKMRDIG